MRRLITYLLLFSSSMLYAYELEVNGVYIGIIGTRIAYVTSRGEETSEPCYSGDVVVPEQVTYNGRVYNVTSVADNAFAASYLVKEGLALEQLGDKAAALECYKTIKDKYPQSIEAFDIDRYIAAVEE